jgi:hypothetical protein
MAGLYITLERSEQRRLEGVADAMRYRSEEMEIWSGEAISYVWLAHDCKVRYGPAIDPNSGVHVVCGGRLVYSAGDWARATGLPFHGGLAGRIVLDTYLRHGPERVAPFNGSASIAIWDPRVHRLHLFTDQFGYFPLYEYGSDGGKVQVVTTFPDAIRKDCSLEWELDDVSMAEFLRAWRVTPPYTYYKNLRHVGSATHCIIDPGTGNANRSLYWKPFENGFYSSVHEAGEDLAAALKLAVSERTAAAKKTCLFVSGGSDSRVMLFGADDPSKIVGINLYESTPTPESDVAKQLCDRVGVRFIGQSRDNDYYPRMLEENVRWSGAMWSAEDSHYLGFMPIVEAEAVDLVMTACTTDWVFKGYGLEKQYRKLFGRYLPIKEFSPIRRDCFLPNEARMAPAKFREEIDARFASWFSECPRELRNDEDYLRVEDRRIRPACYTVSVSGQMMYRVFPYSTFLADARVANCYAKIPAWMKLNGEVWGDAASRVCSKATDIVDSNFGWSVNASVSQKLAAFGRGWVQRRIGSLIRKRPNQQKEEINHPPCYASWPDYGWYAKNSPTVKRQWMEVDSDLKMQVTEAWGGDPWARTLEQWAENPLDFFRILTLLAFLKQVKASHAH